MDNFTTSITRNNRFTPMYLIVEELQSIVNRASEDYKYWGGGGGLDDPKGTHQYEKSVAVLPTAFL